MPTARPSRTALGYAIRDLRHEPSAIAQRAEAIADQAQDDA